MSKYLFFFSGTASSLAWTSIHYDRYIAFGLLLLVSLILWFLGEYMK